MYYFYIFIFIFLVMITRIYFIMFRTHKRKEKKLVRTSPAKTMIILGSGGHTAEMMRILRYLDFKNYYPRVYVYADTDLMSIQKVKELEKDNTDYKTIVIRRSREIHQSYYTSIYTTIRATVESIPHIWRESPRLLLCNGPGTCVPLCTIAFLFKLFYIMDITIVFIESFCRVKTLSLTGKILYYIVDYHIVQWPYLYKPTDRNNKTLYIT
ncbi:UDP-N-acetylglucosamine transferase subunit ALG14 homolog [Ceratina calcarata]|uniref:UDP-N-acetylglucosamine transferase subunit ALG14 n=1 Tax=Ceratina calcarata TaxID=156304 RepID=A0AAJ7S3Q7_9HYME|nr:UDP-N-acetylglucosamine transferase subunit ALG14 homolog [Ceratina calcarata]